MQKLFGWAGVAGVALPLLGQAVVPIWTFPATTASGAEITAYAASHRAALQLVMAVNAASVTLWLVFGCGLAARLTGGLRTAVAGGFAAFTGLLLAGFTAFDLIVYRLPDPASARLLYDLTFGLLAMSGLPTAVALGAFALSGRRGGLPARTAVLAAVAAAAHVALLLSFVVPSGFFSLQGLVIAAIPALLFAWILDTGWAVASARPSQS